MIGQVKVRLSEVAELVEEGQEDRVVGWILTEGSERRLVVDTVLTPIHDEVGVTSQVE